MSKSTYFTGQPVYSQVIKLLVLLSGKLQNAENRFIQHLEQCGNYRKTFFTGVRSALSIMDSTAGSPSAPSAPTSTPNARALRARPAFSVICLHLFTQRM